MSHITPSEGEKDEAQWVCCRYKEILVPGKAMRACATVNEADDNNCAVCGEGRCKWCFRIVEGKIVQPVVEKRKMKKVAENHEGEGEGGGREKDKGKDVSVKLKFLG